MKIVLEPQYEPDNTSWTTIEISFKSKYQTPLILISRVHYGFARDGQGTYCHYAVVIWSSRHWWRNW